MCSCRNPCLLSLLKVSLSLSLALLFSLLFEAYYLLFSTKYPFLITLSSLLSPLSSLLSPLSPLLSPLSLFFHSGSLYLSSPSSLSTSPNGNGGLFKSLVTSGVLSDLSSKGVRYVFAYSVDNVLVRVADPSLLGSMDFLVRGRKGERKEREKGGGGVRIFMVWVEMEKRERGRN